MASKRDLYQSYQFMMQRLISSLVLRETDPLQSPLRRMIGSAFGSVMIAILALAVAGVIGLIKPGGNNSWKTADAVIVEEETGAQYVWIPDKSGVHHLHPVPNLGSGALLIGTSQTVSVSRNSLNDAPRGPMLGIPGTLNSLPAKDDLLGLPWTLCSLPAEDRAGVLVPNTALAVGQKPTSGEALKDRALVLRDIETNEVYLVWNSHRYRMTNPQAALAALGLGGYTQIRVGTAWLTSLPAGADLGPLNPPGSGQPSAGAPGFTVGQLVMNSSPSGDVHYLVESDGLLPISATQAALNIQATGPATTITTPQLSGLTVKPAPAPDPAAIPMNMPDINEPRSADSTVCVSFGSNPATPSVSVEARVEGAEMAPATPRREADGAVLADRVLVQPGHGAVVRAQASPTDPSGGIFIITDDGKRYAVQSRDSLAVFGFGDVEPIAMPASLIDRITQGAALDPEAAKLPT